ncbi:ribonuclease P protein subunit p30-like [Daphnia pulex]|uniref:ribonuclease P protein subunit p30-like n=1 Tax=Daphnia pulex TaxID=6669 RepID=UPI001EDF710C|nr:ribonuclease P protein subunit p30-like [Daphnia pulex]
MLSDPVNTQKLIQSGNTKKSDLIAVCPTTTAAFLHAAANMDIDIITYHPTETKELLRFTRKHYRQATDRGIFFEIPYSHMLRDSSNRKKIIQISHLYHTVGKSRNVIISSGALTPLELRNPYDVANLGLLLGLSEGEARSALNLSGRSVALHAVTRKTGKCVSFIAETDKLDPEEQWKAKEITDAEERLAGEPEPKKMKMETA